MRRAGLGLACALLATLALATPADARPGSDNGHNCRGFSGPQSHAQSDLAHTQTADNEARTQANCGANNGKSP